MVIRRVRKVRKRRGSRHHGWGVQKGHKKHGIKGGRGKAGTTSHRWIQVVKLRKQGIQVLGKHGFKRPLHLSKPTRVINVSHLDAMIDTLVQEGKATREGNIYRVDLQKLGYEKLLAQGNITKHIEITIEMASERAIEKINAAGGKVHLLEQQEE